MLASAPLTASFAIQKRVIKALILREMITRYGRNNIGFLWLFVEPMMFTLMILGLWTVMKGDSSQVPLVEFTLTGYSSVLMWRNATTRCTKAIESNLSLMYHRHVKAIDIFLARILLELAGASASFLVLGAFFYLIGWIELPRDYFTLISGWFLLAWFGVGLALIMGALTEFSEIIDRLWGTASFILFPLSGAMFMVDWFPPEAQKALLYLPMVHGCEMLREGFFGNSATTHFDITFLATVCLIMTFVGLTLLRHASENLEPK